MTRLTTTVHGIWRVWLLDSLFILCRLLTFRLLLDLALGTLNIIKLEDGKSEKTALEKKLTTGLQVDPGFNIEPRGDSVNSELLAMLMLRLKLDPKQCAYFKTCMDLKSIPLHSFQDGSIIGMVSEDSQPGPLTHSAMSQMQPSSTS